MAGGAGAALVNISDWYCVEEPQNIGSFCWLTGEQWHSVKDRQAVERGASV